MYEATIKFEFNGRKLTARVDLNMLDEIVDEDNNYITDSELEEVLECTDSVTGENITVTEGLKSAIILALRKEASEINADDETTIERYFKWFTNHKNRKEPK